MVFEEFYTDKEDLDLHKFKSIGVIRNPSGYEEDKLKYFLKKISEFKTHGVYDKEKIVDLFFHLMPGFDYEDKGKYLDQKM